MSGLGAGIRIAWPLLALVAVLSVSLAACGGDEEAANGGANGDVNGGGVTPAPDGTLTVEAGDNWFVSEGDQIVGRVRIGLSVGDEVEVLMTNSGRAIHNLRFAGYDSEYDTEDDFVTDPEAVKAGKAGGFSFSAGKTGSFPFRCDFHQSEMKGTVVVE